jgi:hypothetical protein
LSGDKAGEPRVGPLAHDDAVTVGLDGVIGSARAQVERSPYGFALVVGQDRTVLGRLRKAALEGDANATAEQAMDPRRSAPTPASTT